MRLTFNCGALVSPLRQQLGLTSLKRGEQKRGRAKQSLSLFGLLSFVGQPSLLAREKSGYKIVWGTVEIFSLNGS